MKVQIEFWRYKDSQGIEDDEMREDLGLSQEKETYFDEGHISIDRIEAFCKNREGNIRIWMYSGEEFTVRFEEEIWNELELSISPWADESFSVVNRIALDVDNDYLGRKTYYINSHKVDKITYDALVQKLKSCPSKASIS